MGFTDKDFKDPLKMFDARTRQLRVRIQTLETLLVVVQHPYSKAIITQELNNAIDEYVARNLSERTQQAD